MKRFTKFLETFRATSALIPHWTRSKIEKFYFSKFSQKSPYWGNFMRETWCYWWCYFCVKALPFFRKFLHISFFEICTFFVFNSMFKKMEAFLRKMICCLNQSKFVYWNDWLYIVKLALGFFETGVSKRKMILKSLLY